MELGCHVSHMGHKSESVRQSVGYKPTPGLVLLFTETGGRRLNPKPPIWHQHHRHTYADAVCGSMEQGGAPVNNNRPGYGKHGYQSGAPRGVGQADMFHGGFNRLYQGYGGGTFGRRGGLNRFQYRGRGFGRPPLP
jgi:hypothetical protein